MKLDDHPDPATRWKHRRRLTYAVVAAALLYPLLLLVTVDPVVRDLAWPFYAFCGSIACAYMGTTAWESISINRSGP